MPKTFTMPNNMTLTQTDGRENILTSVTDIAGRVIGMTDATSNMTTTAYCADSDNPALITNAQGKTTCYKYDIRGRKTAEYGTAVQPACFGYDNENYLITLKTFRVDEATINADPSGTHGRRPDEPGAPRRLRAGIKLQDFNK